jgi:uncharacterized protein
MDKAERREGAGRTRRCAATGEVCGEAALIRFVADPAGQVHPDPAAKAPGRGVWVRADVTALAHAVKRNVFARGLKRTAIVAPDLIARTGEALHRRCLELLSMGRRGGHVVSGFDQVEASLRKARPGLRIEAADGAADGRRKLDGLTRVWESEGATPVSTVTRFTGAELGMALGRESVIHALLLPGRFAQSWAAEIGRLEGVMPSPPPGGGT